MIKPRIFVIASLTLFTWLLMGTGQALAACTEPSMSDYQSYPVFQASAVEPNIVILLDNGAEMQYAITHSDYGGVTTYDTLVTVSGNSVEVTDSDSSGKTTGTGFYNENGYTIDKQGNRYYLVKIKDDLTSESAQQDGGLMADGNFSNVFTVTVGGVTNVTVTVPLYASNSVDADGIKDSTGPESDRYFRYSANYLNWLFFNHTSSISGASPYSPYDGTALPTKSRFYYARQALMTVAHQTLREAKFGIYNFTNTEGGSQVQPLGYVSKSSEPDSIDDDGDGQTDEWDEVLESNYINNINNMGTVIYSPLAEGLAEIGGYYDSQSSHVVGESCQKNFVIIISPGKSSADVTDGQASQYEPDSLSGVTTESGVTVEGNVSWDGDDAAGGIGEGHVKVGTTIYEIPVFQHPTDSDLNGSTWLDDVAAYLSTNDVVSYVSGYQNVLTYTIGFMSEREEYSIFLKNTSNNGNGNINLYDDSDPEYGKYHFEATSPDTLATTLLNAINDILKRAASGTAVSVLATSGEGEGNLVQAYFRPSVTISGATEVKWVGYLQSVWVDSYGNLREDTDGDLALDTATDKVISYFLDSESGEAKIKRFDVSGATPYPDVDSASYEEKELDEISPLWEAGSLLAQTNADDRKIFTYIDKDTDGAAEEPFGDDDPFDDDGEVVQFYASGVISSGVSNLVPYFGVRDDNTWAYLGATQEDRAFNIIEYIRGKETGFSGTTNMHVRTRTIDGNVWKLGDIVHSTPVSISKPPDNFHLIYGDASYQEYYNAFKDRETVVYVGANDGMLHAFTSWEYDSTSNQYTRPATAPGDENIGDELWAYIPQTLLPHLKWLPASNYSHVYYMDLKPKVFDAKILPDNTHYADSDADDNWGTILLAGMNMGGREICVEDTFDDGSGVTAFETRTFYPSYVAMDITDPRNPRLLWERTYEGLGMTKSIPAVVKVKDKWFAVFGSGVTDYEGNSYQKGHVFVVDLKTGNASTTSGTTNGWLFETSETNAFLNSPASLDKNLNFNVDAIYFGETYGVDANSDGDFDDDNEWKGKLYKITVPWADAGGTYQGTASGNTDYYVDNPTDASNPWTFSTLFDATRPITAPASLSIDSYDNVWVYFGTGRYIGQDDKTNDDTQYLFGVVDPFFNSYYVDPSGTIDYYHNYSSTLTLEMSDLFNADPYTITTAGKVFTGSPLALWGTWDDLLTTARDEDGWYRTLTTSKERSVIKISVLGGIAFAPSFIPNEEVCGFGGDSNLYGLYFETGTAYYKSVFADDLETITVDGDQYQKVSGKISLGLGKSSALGIHVGQEEGAKAFIQQSTGTVLEEVVTPAFNIKSGIINWREK